MSGKKNNIMSITTEEELKEKYNISASCCTSCHEFNHWFYNTGTIDLDGEVIKVCCVVKEEFEKL